MSFSEGQYVWLCFEIGFPTDLREILEDFQHFRYLERLLGAIASFHGDWEVLLVGHGDEISVYHWTC